VSKLPQWVELTYLAASIAERAAQDDKALQWYQQLLKLAGAAPQGEQITPDLRRRIEVRSAALDLRVRTARDQREQAFVDATKRYAQRLGLPGSDPEIAFVTPRTAGVIAVWNDEAQRYEINPEQMNYPGVPEYVALMGRFMATHFRRCFGGGATVTPTEATLWNEFRLGVTGYLLSTDLNDDAKTLPYGAYKEGVMAKALKSIEAELQGNHVPVRKLALALLDRFQCDWTRQPLPQTIQAINEELKLIPPESITKAFAA
jgi:hypothetical protein